MSAVAGKVSSPWGGITVNDAHIHFFSRRFFEILGGPANLSPEQIGARLGWEIPPGDAAGLAAHWARELDRHGVTRAAMFSSLPGDEASAIAAADHIPGRFLAYAMLNPLALPGETRLAVERRQLHAVCLFPAMHRYSLHDEQLNTFWDWIGGIPGAIVFVHCGVLTVGVRAKLGLPSLFDMRFSNPLDVHAIALRYPKVRFVIPHFGAGLFREALMLCDLCPNVYLDTSSSNRWTRYEEVHLDLRTVFRRALDVAGPRRLLFGTDSSFFPRGWNSPVFEAQSRALYELGISAPDAAAIFGGNFDELAESAHG